MLIAFNKPFGVLSQFTPDGSPNRPLAEFGFPKNVYPIGRLDADSEGLLLLSDEPAWNARLLEPRHARDLRARGILYAPDYVINAGGIINVGVELLPGGYDEAASLRMIARIYEHLKRVFEITA